MKIAAKKARELYKHPVGSKSIESEVSIKKKNSFIEKGDMSIRKIQIESVNGQIKTKKLDERKGKLK
ncbi:hypothetical protein [Neobacillus sp. D3-1R]|uniref:hypothetical protein n=1 Tax=Neobacillus sp. D3-1R TaxID=3445778 RepID=UPI003F9F5B36